MAEKQLWSARKATIVTCVIVVIGVLAGGAVWAGASNAPDPEASGEKIGRALLPITVLAGVIAYFVQRSRLADRR